MRDYGKTGKIKNGAAKKPGARSCDIFISLGLVMIGLVMAAANSLFNFVYCGERKKIKTNLFVKTINKFLNRCALSFTRLESKLSFL